MHLTTGTSRWIVVVRRCAALVSAGCLFVACATPPQQSANEQHPTVVNIIDGDTIVIAFGPNTVETVRLLGVDTPETVDPSRPEQCFGAEASRFLHTVIPPLTKLRIERDVEARDHFGRLLGYVFRADDDFFVNEAILANGYADISIYEPNSTYEPALTAAVTGARTRNVGLWKVCGGADVAIDPPALQHG